MMFVAHGSVRSAIARCATARPPAARAVALKAGSGGATLWRWEMVTQEGGGGDYGRGVS